jgi:hypothetical protein
LEGSGIGLMEAPFQKLLEDTGENQETPQSE